MILSFFGHIQTTRWSLAMEEIDWSGGRIISLFHPLRSGKKVGGNHSTISNSI
jgi:hypothetical protein